MTSYKAKKELAEKLYTLLMEVNEADGVYSAQSSIFGDLAKALRKIDIVCYEGSIECGELILKADENDSLGRDIKIMSDLEHPAGRTLFDY